MGPARRPYDTFGSLVNAFSFAFEKNANASDLFTDEDQLEPARPVNPFHASSHVTKSEILTGVPMIASTA